MTSFKEKIGRKRARKTEQKLSIRFVLTHRGIENSKKIEKKFRKLENTIVASFQDKVSWKSPRKGKNKNFRCLSFLPTRTRKLQKTSKKIVKIKKYH